MRQLRALIMSAMMAAALLHNVQAEEALVYVSAFATGDDGAIHAYRLQLDTGELTLLNRNTDIEQPFFMALAPDARFLYAIHAPGEFGGTKHEQVAAFQVVDHQGQLKLLNRQSTKGTASCYLDVDDQGKTLVVANYSTGSVAALPLREDGSLGEIATFVQHHGSSVDKERQEGPHAHCMVISPDNRFALAADLGLDQVLIYQLDAAKASLTSAAQPFARTLPGAGPRHLTFHPSGEHVYVINELANSITHFSYLADSGMLVERATISTLPEDYTGTSYCADVKITPNGRFLFGTNRGHDSIAAYSIGDDGQLKLIEIQPSGGKGPQNLAITPDGRWLLCANMPGNNLVVLKIDPASGQLDPVGEPVAIVGPSCILLP